MLDETCLALNAINRDFYRRSAESFSKTRQRPWPGWGRVAEHVHRRRARTVNEEEALSVLDIGCGNGRFGVYAAEEFRDRLDFFGLDSSPELLSFARSALTDVRASLVQHDLVTTPPSAMLPLDAGRQHDLVALFGIMHHLPGRERRRALLATCHERLKPGGILAVTLWQFAARERFIKKIVPWNSVADRVGVDPTDLESGDTLLTWGAGAKRWRYCHFADADEGEEWASLPGFERLDEYDADGETNDLNHYLLLRRKPAAPTDR